MHEYRELENDGAKLQIDYKYYKGLSFSLQSWGFMENFFGGEMSYHQVSLCLFLRSYLNKLSNGTFITFYEHNWLFIVSDSTNHSFNLKSRHAVQFTGEKSKLVATSDDDTLLNGLKYGWLPITGTFS